MADKIDIDQQTTSAAVEKTTEEKPAESEETEKPEEILEKARSVMKKVATAFSRIDPDVSADEIVERAMRQILYERSKK